MSEIGSQYVSYLGSVGRPVKRHSTSQVKGKQCLRWTSFLNHFLRRKTCKLTVQGSPPPNVVWLICIPFPLCSACIYTWHFSLSGYRLHLNARSKQGIRSAFFIILSKTSLLTLLHAPHLSFVCFGFVELYSHHSLPHNHSYFVTVFVLVQMSISLSFSWPQSPDTSKWQPVCMFLFLTLVSTVVCLTMFSNLCWWFLVGFGPVVFLSSSFCICSMNTLIYEHTRWHDCLQAVTVFEDSPLQGFSAASVAQLSSSSPAPSLCWWFVWPDTSAGDAGAGLETSPLPQHACKHTQTK